MTNIHPSAVIEAGARIADDAVVGPFCHVGAHVVIGAGTRLIGHVTVIGRTRLGEHNTIWPQAVIGADPQDLKYRGERTTLEIGDHNEIRESVTIHMGTENGGGVTRIGSDNLLMCGAHVAHDCVVGNFTVLANNVLLAGHVVVEDHANIAGIVGVHHYCTIGQYSYVGGMTRVVKDVAPFMIYEGDPARERGVNAIGLERNRFDPASIHRLKDAARRLFRLDRDANAADKPQRNSDEVLRQLEAEYPDDACIDILVGFLRRRAIGMSGRYRETQRRDNRRAGAAQFVAAPAGNRP